MLKFETENDIDYKKKEFTYYKEVDGEALKIGHTKEGFIGAIEKCGELLAEHFPAHSENPNELPDGLVILTED